MKLAIVSPDYSSPLWESIPEDHRHEIRAQLAAFREAPEKGVSKWFAPAAAALGMAEGTFRAKYYALRGNGGDWKALLDERLVPADLLPKSPTREPRFITYLLKLVEEFQRKNVPAFRELRRQWRAREGTDKGSISGYEGFPGWPALPDGWSNRNLADIVTAETNKAAMRSVRVGTSSKTNPFLPHTLSTRVNLWQGAVIQLDDQWHDNYVTVRRGNKPQVVRALELNALDLFSAHRIHWGCKPRLRRDDGTMQNIGGSDGRLFLAGLLHRLGRCPRGMSFMVEHATMSIPEDIERLLYDYSGGAIRVNRQPIEGKQAALTGYWSGTEGGNFRAKAALESIHARIRNDLARLPMQTGSPSSGLLGPVTTERHRKWLESSIDKIEKYVPQRLSTLRTGTLDFHTQFVPFLERYYHFELAMRTDHDLEGWEALNHFATEYTALPGSDQWISEEALLENTDFDDSRSIILMNASAKPDRWSRQRKLSPLEVWNRRERWEPVPPALICDILTRDLAREFTARRGFVEFMDKEFAPDPLTYVARFRSGPRAGQEIGHGEKVSLFANPYDDSTAMVVDAKGRFQGELPLYQRFNPINEASFTTDAPFDERPDLISDELKAAAREKHSRIEDILGPVRVRHAAKVQEAIVLRDEAKDLANPKCPITGEEIAAANLVKRTIRRSAAASDQADAALESLAGHREEQAPPNDLDF